MATSSPETDDSLPFKDAGGEEVCLESLFRFFIGEIKDVDGEEAAKSSSKRGGGCSSFFIRFAGEYLGEAIDEERWVLLSMGRCYNDGDYIR